MIQALEINLVTNGNGVEAVQFYQDALQAEVCNLKKWADFVHPCPKEHEHLLLSAELVVGEHRLMISDENPAFEYRQGYNFSASIVVDTADNARCIYEKLSRDARKIIAEYQETPWAPAYANLEDQFGICWQIMVGA
ncbi:VOC family protein [Streptococcus suis]|nr:VOC family protein [Streptococcus suis]